MISENEIEAKVRQIITENVKLKVPIAEIGSDDPFDDFGISSMNFVRLIVAIEGEFAFTFSNETLQFENLNTLHKLVSFIASQING